MINTFKKKEEPRSIEISILVQRNVNKKGAIDGRDKAGAYGSVQGVGVQVPRKALAVPPSGEGEPQCRRDAKVKRVAARQERRKGTRSFPLALHRRANRGHCETLNPSTGHPFHHRRSARAGGGAGGSVARRPDATRFPTALRFCACTRGNRLLQVVTRGNLSLPLLLPSLFFSPFLSFLGKNRIECER